MNANRTNLEIIAPSIEEAIEEGLSKLGVPEEDVEIEILDEGTKGLFGLGSRQARIRLTVAVNDETDHFETKPDESVGEEAELGDDEKLPIVSVIGPDESVGEIDHTLEIARETVSDLLEMMRVPAEVTAYIGEPDDERSRAPIHVDIHGQDLSILIGRKAETLNALQFITRLIMGKELEKSVPLIVDVEGYRQRRERQLRQLARRVADQVRATGRSQSLEPMVPAERRLVHIELRNDPDLYTQSSGEGNRRKVVIHIKS
jgi:spoIIIJ-associated protein